MATRPKELKLVVLNLAEDNIPKGQGQIQALDLPLERPDFYEHMSDGWNVVSHAVTQADAGLLLTMFLEREIPAAGLSIQ